MRALLLLICLLACPWLAAKQALFNKQEGQGDIRYQYQWRGLDGSLHDLDFSLPKQKIGEQHQRVTQYQQGLAQHYVYIALQKAAAQADPKEVRIDIRPQGLNFEVRVSSRSEAMLKSWQSKMADLREQAFEEYLTSHYYNQFSNHLGQQGVKPDHLRYARESLELLLPVAQAIYKKISNNSDSREYINLLLSWIQSIPYDRLENRLTSNGAGYFSPVEVINNNLGDCDSKSTLTIALLRALLPKVPIVMVYLPNHALVGVGLPHRETEPTLTHEGIDYLLLEPTGPALMPIGIIGPQSNGAIQSGMYSVERMP